VYKVGIILHMLDGVIMKNQKLYHREVFYHAYSTYIHASNQAIIGQKPIRKA